MEEDPVRKAVENERARLAVSAIISLLKAEPGPWSEQDLTRATLDKADFGSRAVRAAIDTLQVAKVMLVLPPDQIILNEDALAHYSDIEHI